MTTYEKGVFAEQVAARFLTNTQNMTILEHRYKTYSGEVDLIVIDPKKTLIAVEIKQRKTIDEARYAITPYQQKRIIKSMEIFLCRNPTIDYTGMRFDAILFNRDLTERLYMKNAWIPI